MTAYDLSIESCGKPLYSLSRGKTYSGFNLNGKNRKNAMTIAADPNILPMGTKVFILFDEKHKDFNGIYTVRDIGGAIKGNKLDLFMGDYCSNIESKDVVDFGIAKAKIFIISNN